VSESQQIADLFLAGYCVKSLAARFERSREGIENILRYELDAARERAVEAAEKAKENQK
jgi:uncharacterized protein (DUF433 family)